MPVPNRFLAQQYTLLVVAFVLAAAPGCRRSADFMKGSVTGTVKLDGQPLAGAMITFTPHDESNLEAVGPSYGRTDAAGHYQLQHSPHSKGAAVGLHRVRITVEEESSEQESDDENAPAKPVAKPAAAITVPEKYNIKSELLRDIFIGDQVINFDLTSK